MKAPLILCLALMLAACGAPPASEETPSTSGQLTIENAWAAPTPDGVDVSAGYLTIINATGADDRLLGATSPRAERMEVHEMNMTDGVMQMRAMDSLVIGAGDSAILAPGGAHLMFYGVSEPFAEGQEIPIQLTFERAGSVDIALPVRRAGAQDHTAH